MEIMLTDVKVEGLRNYKKIIWVANHPDLKQ